MRVGFARLPEETGRRFSTSRNQHYIEQKRIFVCPWRTKAVIQYPAGKQIVIQRRRDGTCSQAKCAVLKGHAIANLQTSVGN